MLIYYLALFVVAIISTWWILKKVLKIALLKNIVDNPDARKLQKTPVPVLGGIAVFFGITISLAVTGLFFETSSLFTILGVIAIMLYVGTMDDILSLSPGIRFLIEIVVVLLLIFCNKYSLNNFHGLWGVGQISECIAIPLTVFACVGIINAINLIDGVDGLCSGYCIVACTVFAAFFLWAEDIEAGSLAVLSVGALLPFYVHNVFGKKSKMFLGDGGTLLMGTIISSFVIGALNTNSVLASKVDPRFGIIPFTLAVLSIPVFDTLRVMSMRIIRGKSPFMPDRTHLHHLLFDMGFSHIGTSLAVIFSNIGVIVVWYISYLLGASIETQLYIVLSLGILVTFGFYKFVRIHQQRDTKIFHALKRISQWTHIGHTHWFESIRNFIDKGGSDAICLQMKENEKENNI